MDHGQVLRTTVLRLSRRIRLLLAQQGMCVGLTWAALAGLLLVACTRFRWWTDGIDYLWALLLAGAVAGLLAGWTRRITPLVAAQIADERAGLKERLSTAVELAASGDGGEVARAQLADAARHARELEPARVLPWRPPAQWRRLAGAAVLLAAAVFLPELSLFRSAQERQDRAAMRAEGARIRQIAREVEKRRTGRRDESNDALLRRIARNMEQLGKEMDRNRIPKKDALLRVSALQEELKQAESRLSDGARKSLEQVAAELRSAAERAQRQGKGHEAKALRQMAERLDARNFGGAQQQLEEMARQMQSGQMQPEDARQAAATLRQMAEAMAGSGLEQASQEMKDAARQLEKAAQAGQQLQQQMQSAGSEAERQQLQQQMARAMSQGLQQAGEQTQKAGGT